MKGDCWEYQGNDNVLARATNWTQGINERIGAHSVPPSGTYLEVDGSLLKSYLQCNHLRLGYVIKERYVLRRYSYEEEKVVENYSFYKVSGLIV